MRRSNSVKLQKKLERLLPRFLRVLAGMVLIVALCLAAYQIPGIKRRVEWRLDAAGVFVRSLLNPIGDLPTSVPQAELIPEDTATAFPATPSATPTQAKTLEPSPAPENTATITPSNTPLPPKVNLQPPEFEPQDWNNCGPVALSMYLNYYGWDGDQFAISDLIKPERADRNGNLDELVDYVYNNVWWLNADVRVGGNIQLLKEFISAGIPVMVEESMYMAEEFWFNDDRWAGHYLLLTGYDDVHQTFTTQDSFIGPDQEISFQKLDENWQAFNRVYMIVYRPENLETIQAILAENWDMDVNRQNALKTARQETEIDPQNPFAWFNLGSNLVYFERYSEAVEAYDQARSLALPQRMLRYQFGPFLAYFHTGLNEDLLSLTEYALTVTPNSEEALLWRGWALYRAGRYSEAMDSFQKALEYHPGYEDAQYAINYLQTN
jgi:tetratricopeptide (TPR) repeat protein